MHGKVVVCLSVSSAFGKMTIRQQIRRELDVVALTKKTRWNKTGGSDAARVGFRAGGWGLRRKWRGGGCGVPAEPQDMHSMTIWGRSWRPLTVLLLEGEFRSLFEEARAVTWSGVRRI